MQEDYLSLQNLARLLIKILFLPPSFYRMVCVWYVQDHRTIVTFDPEAELYSARSAGNSYIGCGCGPWRIVPQRGVLYHSFKKILSLVVFVCMANRINVMIKRVQIGSNVHNATVLMPSNKGSISTEKGFMVLLTFLLLQPRKDAIKREQSVKYNS